MKQAHLGGRTRGLRPGQQRQLERLSHRRHPERCGADLLTLERLAELSLELKEHLHLVLDGRGLCRLLWIGPLTSSAALLEHLPQAPRRQAGGWRLISCPIGRQRLQPDPHAAVVALDLNPTHWLRLAQNRSADGQRPAVLLLPDRRQAIGWHCAAEDDLRDLCDLEIEGLAAERPAPPVGQTGEERVLLLTLSDDGSTRGERELAELEGLVRSAGALPVAVVRQRPGLKNPQTLWGTGKLEEAAVEARRNHASLVITDRELTPVQARNLERLLDCPVMDRSELILDIFAQRAGSAAGRLQVELAQLRYRLPRLLGRGRSLSRQGGGIGTRGPGETQLEKDRRAIARRIDRLMQDLKQLRQHRQRLRDRRETFARVALVGYTNAGKSSLMNALCGRRPSDRVVAEDKLFATLDPTTRRLEFPREGAAPDTVLITDTVGFIRALPDPLVEAFRATLEETLAADILLLVVDLGDPDWAAHLATVHKLLDALDSTALRRVVANQIDRCPLEAIEAIRAQEPDTLFLSAVRGDGLRGLRDWLDSQIWQNGQNQAPV
ncbi:MAG: GTPase HflX [Synechococcus sp.]